MAILDSLFLHNRSDTDVVFRCFTGQDGTPAQNFDCRWSAHVLPRAWALWSTANGQLGPSTYPNVGFVMVTATIEDNVNGKNYAVAAAHFKADGGTSAQSAVATLRGVNPNFTFELGVVVV